MRAAGLSTARTSCTLTHTHTRPVVRLLTRSSRTRPAAYGKKNCLTPRMYNDNDGGPLSLTKILTLVAGKLREGVVQC